MDIVMELEDPSNEFKSSLSSEVLLSFGSNGSCNSKDIEETKQQLDDSIRSGTSIARTCTEIKGKTKRIRKKKELRRANFVSITQPCLSSQTVFHVYGDISMTSDFQIRLDGAVAWGLFGIDYLRGTKVTTNAQTVEVEMEFTGSKRISFDTLMTKISEINSPVHQKFIDAFQFFRSFLEERRIEALISQKTVEEQENEYEAFIEQSMSNIAQMQETESLYGFSMGRCGVFQGEVEIKRLGYSKEILNILCLNSEILQQMYMRNKPISMLFDEKQAQELSLVHMEGRVKGSIQMKSRVRVTTIDGYELWVNQTMDKCIDINKSGRDKFFFSNLAKFDIELQDLQGLIDYRTALAERSTNGISIDRFVQVELSQMLEDVEYSVQSEMFLEKYYKQSVKELDSLKQKMVGKQCKFRNIREDLKEQNCAECIAE